MATAATEKFDPIDSSFIKRTIVGGTAASILKGIVWGNAVAISQSFGKYFFVHLPPHFWLI